MVHLFGGCAGEEIMRGGKRGVDSLCYCLMTLFLLPLILRMWPEDSLYEIFRPEHWSRDINTLLTMPWIPYSRHWTSSSQQEDFCGLICGPLNPQAGPEGHTSINVKVQCQLVLNTPKNAKLEQAIKRPTRILQNQFIIIYC